MLVFRAIVILCCLAMLSCHPKRHVASTEGVEPLPKLLIRVSEAARRGDRRLKAKTELVLLQEMQRIPYPEYFAIERPLLDAIGSEGVAPYAGIALEYGYRLLRVNTSESRRRFKRLSTVLAGAKNKPRGASEFVWVRTIDGRRFKPYSLNIVGAAIAMMRSDYGQTLVASLNATPESFVRYVGIQLACGKPKASQFADDLQSGTDADAKKVAALCQKYEKLVGSRFNQSQGGDVFNAIRDIATNGVLGSIEECVDSLQGQDFVAKAVEPLESFLSCQNEKQMAASAAVSGAGLDPSGLMVELQPVMERAWMDLEFHDGELHVHDNVEREYRFEKDGNDIALWERSYEHKKNEVEWESSSGERARVTADGDGNLQERTWSDGKGSSYNAEYNPGKNTLSREVIVEKQGNTTVERVVQYDADGNKVGETVKTTTTNDDGTTSESVTQLDADGNPVAAQPAPSTSTQDPPRGEPQADACFSLLTDDPGDEAVNPGRLLDPWIIPREDAGSGAIDACLDGAMTARPSGCRSAMLCLDGYVDADCNCHGSTHSEGLPASPSGGRCAQMMCTAGACDPTTGLCVVNTDGGAVLVPGAGLLPKGPGMLGSGRAGMGRNPAVRE